MPTVTEDIANGHSISEARGYTDIQRVFRVTNLTQSQPWLLLLEALDDPDVPQVGDTYPDVSGSPGTSPYTKYTRCIVRSRQAFPDGCNAARVVVDYSNEPTSAYDQEVAYNQSDPLDDVKSVSFSLQSETVTTDRLGADLVIEAPAKFGGPDKNEILDEVETMRPVGELVFERIEVIPVAEILRDAVGSVNSTTAGVYQPRTLRLDGVDQTTDDGGRTWRTTYRFAYKADTWDHRTRWRNPSTNKIPPEAVEVTFELLDEYDFNTLNLDFTDSQTPIT